MLDGKFLVQICSVDQITRIDVVYHFSSLAQNHIFQVKVPADHEQPEVASITPLWIGATLQEREVYDLMGVIFDRPSRPDAAVPVGEVSGSPAAQGLHGAAGRTEVRSEPVPEAGRRPDRRRVPAAVPGTGE